MYVLKIQLIRFIIKVNKRNGRYEYECSACQCYVAENTKHCKVCNKCVKEFDHHCIWLNNCIGYNNYRYFIALISLYLAFSIFFILLSIAVIVRAENEQIYFNSKIGVRVYVSVCLFCKLIIAILVAVLLCFHIYLISEDRTTYEFIIRRREAKEKKMEGKRVQSDSFSRNRNSPNKSSLKRQTEEYLDASPKQQSNIDLSHNEMNQSKRRIFKLIKLFRFSLFLIIISIFEESILYTERI